MDTSLTLDSEFRNPTSFDNSFSIGEIMQQQSITVLDNAGSNEINASANNSTISHAAEQSSRHLVVAAFPKTAAAYVIDFTLVTSTVPKVDRKSVV